MILTTTPAIEGRTIIEYKGVVFGEVISGVNFLRDFAASIRNIVGGRSASYEEELITARTQAMQGMSDRASRLGADAGPGACLNTFYYVQSVSNSEDTSFCVFFTQTIKQR